MYAFWVALGMVIALLFVMGDKYPSSGRTQRMFGGGTIGAVITGAVLQHLHAETGIGTGLIGPIIGASALCIISREL